MLPFTAHAIVNAYEQGAQAARRGHDRNPFLEPEDWKRASAWRQGWNDMCEMLELARDLGGE